MVTRVAIIDYGSGNLRSAAKAFERASLEVGPACTVTVTADALVVREASHLVLPGVGAFAACMQGLAALPGIVEALDEAVCRRGRPFLGICVGMQLMARRGLEHGAHDGLGWIAGDVAPLAGRGAVSADAGPLGLRIPHMGWNELDIVAADHPLLAGIAPGSHAYFVHSYALACADAHDVLARVDYGGPLTAAAARANIAGTQFHPEKSQATGLRLISNFLGWRP
jgi:glutamine amidotransferase